MGDDDKGWSRFELKKHSKGIKKHAKKAEGATVRHARRFVVNRWDKISDVRFHVIMWMGGVGLLIALVGLQMVWFQRSYIASSEVSGGTYAEAVKGSINTLNPLYASTQAELSASHLLFSSLYSYDSTGHIHTDLATGMKNEDDKVFTIQLRKDAKWHDGQRVTADDVIFTMGLMKNPVARSVMEGTWRSITVKKIDDYAVQFTLPAAYAAFPQALTFAVLPEHSLKSIKPSALRESTFSNSPVGSGAFSLQLLQVVNQTTNRKIVYLDANKDFYDGKPRLDRMQLHAYADDDSIARALRTGEVTAASDISGDVAQTVDKKRYDVIVKPINSGVYALFNLSNPILKDQNVRRALQQGTDTTSIRSSVYGDPKPLGLPYIASQVPGSEKLEVPKQNKIAAEQLLTETGWVLKDGVRTKNGEKLTIRVVTRKNSEYEAALQTLAGQWRDIGAQVDIEVFDTASAGQSFNQDVLQRRNYDVLIDELAIGGDPDVFAYWHTRGLLNFSNYANPNSDDALTSARTRSDPQLRTLKYLAFAKQWQNDVPAIGLYQSNFIYVDSKDAKSITSNETIVDGDLHYSGVKYWTTEKDSVYKTP